MADPAPDTKEELQEQRKKVQKRHDDAEKIITEQTPKRQAAEDAKKAADAARKAAVDAKNDAEVTKQTAEVTKQDALFKRLDKDIEDAVNARRSAKSQLTDLDARIAAADKPKPEPKPKPEETRKPVKNEDESAGWGSRLLWWGLRIFAILILLLVAGLVINKCRTGSSGAGVPPPVVSDQSPVPPPGMATYSITIPQEQAKPLFDRLMTWLDCKIGECQKANAPVPAKKGSSKKGQKGSAKKGGSVTVHPPALPGGPGPALPGHGRLREHLTLEEQCKAWREERDAAGALGECQQFLPPVITVMPSSKRCPSGSGCK